MKPVYTVDLSPRQNVHIEPSLARDIGDILLGAVLVGLVLVLVILVMA